MNESSSELRHGPNRFQLSSMQNMNEENDEEMKEAVTKVIERLTQEDFHGAFQIRVYDNFKCLYKNVWKFIECTTYNLRGLESRISF